MQEKLAKIEKQTVGLLKELGLTELQQKQVIGIVTKSLMSEYSKEITRGFNEQRRNSTGKSKRSTKRNK